MLLDLSRIRQAETDVERRVDPAQLEGRDHPFQLALPADLRMRVHKDGERYRVAGSVQTRLALACSRCLEAFPLAVNSSFDVRYLPAADTAADDDTEVADDDLSAVFYRDDQIDLLQLIEEQLYLILPMKPLCTASCKGLCPQCGTNLNSEPCACETHWEDPRLAALKRLVVHQKPHDA